jgi:hypothetical protein
MAAEASEPTLSGIDTPKTQGVVIRRRPMARQQGAREWMRPPTRPSEASPATTPNILIYPVVCRSTRPAEAAHFGRPPPNLG